jgi:TetR/AcrR family transcriptional regulator, cholesterol catabolism regulator
MVSGIGRRRAAARAEGGAAYQERRSEVIKAAAEVFKKNGYRGTTMSEVAIALNLDRASLYYYIGSKEELFHEVVGGAVERNAIAAEEILDGPEPAPEKLRRLITSLMVSYAENYPFLYVYIQENLSNVAGKRSGWDRKMRQFNKRYENAVVALVQAGIEEGTFSTQTQPWVIGYGIIGMVAWSNRWFNPNQSPVPAEEIGAAYAETLLGGLQSPGSDSPDHSINANQ